ncbi:hypothetical protein Hanom_Chr12g01143381 [Helianthus anomalus]
MSVAIPLLCDSSVIFDPLQNSCCDFDKALTDQRPVYKSHIKRFWKNATYDEANKVINLVVKHQNEKKKIVVTEALVREVLNFPDDENSSTRFPERMVKGSGRDMWFIIHCVLMSLSHCKGGYDTMHDYQMNMVTALVLNKKNNFSHIVFHYMTENITTKSNTWMYPRFV